MRGAGDQLSVGERIAFHRRRRGLTQSTLAALMGRSEDWLSTELVSRKQLRPDMTEGTAVMETLFELPATDRKRSTEES